MNLRQGIKNYILSKVFDPATSIDLQNVVGWHPIGGSSTYSFYKQNQYENGYSSIRVLAEAFMSIEPFAIDNTGKKVASNVLDRVYTPNTDMSSVDFREALMVTTLVHDKVRLRVHHKGTRINADSITGFTFLEDYSETVVGGKRHYKLTNGDDLTDEEVITLKSIDPNHVTEGFSPSRAARRWTQLDDYIADYQRGFFENGAIPAGQLVITARSTTEFNDIVDMLKARHKGAGKNNNITYTHRPTDQNGAPLNSQIEWVPFSSPNKDLGLKDLFAQVNQKIDSAYGVPASLRAVNDANTYASVRVDELILVKYALKPKTLKIWSKFNHELNRITGGMGMALSFELEMPQLADEEKVRAEAKQTDASTVSTLTLEGYTLDSAIEYVKTGNLEALKIAKPVVEDKPEVVDANDIKDTPDQPIDAFSKAIKEHIDKRFDEMNKPDVVAKQINDVDRQVYVNRMAQVTREQMTRQVNRAVAQIDSVLKTKAYGDATEDEDELFTAQMLSTLLPLIAIYGNKQTSQGMILLLQAGLNTDNIKQFEFTPAQQRAYKEYLARVGTGYAEQTAENIRNILGDGILNGQTKAEIENRLRSEILGEPNEYRVQRLAKTEVNLSEGRASVSAMENIAEQTGYSIYKVWNVSSLSPCEFCSSLSGDRKLVSENFVDLGDEIHGINGGTYLNDFTSTETADAHPNCNCFTTYEVERG